MFNRMIGLTFFLFFSLISTSFASGEPETFELLYNPGPTYKAFGHLHYYLEENGEIVYSPDAGCAQDLTEEAFDGNPPGQGSFLLLTYNWKAGSDCQEEYNQYPGWTFWIDQDPESNPDDPRLITTAVSNALTCSDPEKLREVALFQYRNFIPHFRTQLKSSNIPFSKASVSFQARLRYFDPRNFGENPPKTASVNHAVQMLLPNGRIYHMEFLLFNGGETDDVYDNPYYDPYNLVYYKDDDYASAGIIVLRTFHGTAFGIPQLCDFCNDSNNNNKYDEDECDWVTYHIDYAAIMEEMLAKDEGEDEETILYPKLPDGVEISDCYFHMAEAYVTSTGYDIQADAKNVSIVHPITIGLSNERVKVGHRPGSYTVEVINNSSNKTLNYNIDSGKLPNWLFIQPQYLSGQIAPNGTAPLHFSFGLKNGLDSKGYRQAIIRITDTEDPDNNYLDLIVQQHNATTTKLSGAYMLLLDASPWDAVGPTYDE